MPLPDPHANEPTVEIDRNLVTAFKEAKDAEQAWHREAERLKALIVERIGSAFAATVDDEKVFLYRPRSNYAEARLVKDYPDLTAHFYEYETRSVFNMTKFVQQHPDIAEKYRVRALVEVETYE